SGPGHLLRIVAADEEADQVGGTAQPGERLPDRGLRRRHQVGSDRQAVGEAARQKCHRLASLAEARPLGPILPTVGTSTPANHHAIVKIRSMGMIPTRAAGSAHGNVGSNLCIQSSTLCVNCARAVTYTAR